MALHCGWVRSPRHQKRLQQYGLLVVCSKLCIGPNRLPICHAVREEIKNASDSGWIVASGTETPEYGDNPKNFAMVPWDRLVSTDDTLKILYDQPVGTELTRRHANEPWRWIVDDKVVDADGRLIAEPNHARRLQPSLGGLGRQKCCSKSRRLNSSPSLVRATDLVFPTGSKISPFW